MRAILAKPISHRTKVDTVYPCRTLRQSRRWAAEQSPRASRAACQRGVFSPRSIWSSMNFDRFFWWLRAPRWLITVTGPLGILIQPASQAGMQAARLPLWEALSWPHAGSALFTVTCLPRSPPPPSAPPPRSNSECIYLHLYCSRLKAIIVPA